MGVIQIEGTPTPSVSIAFKIGESVSVALYDPFGGPIRVLHALLFVEVLLDVYEENGGLPPSLRNPNAVMVEYIRNAYEGLRVTPGDLYLGRDGRSYDNSGTGHWVIDIDGDLDAQTRDVARLLRGDDRFIFEMYWLLRHFNNGA